MDEDILEFLTEENKKRRNSTIANNKENFSKSSQFKNRSFSCQNLEIKIEKKKT